MTDVMEEKVVTGRIYLLNMKGDAKFAWNSGSELEVTEARNHFNALKSRGYLAYTVEEGGGKGEVIRDFDPEAQAIIMAPQTQGG